MGQRPVYLIVRNGILLDPEQETAAARDILIRDDTILEVRPPQQPAPSDAAIVDAADRLIIPGLINAHTHGHAVLGKGSGDRWSLELYLNALPWIGGSLRLEDKYTAAALNAVEMVFKGCTATYDLFVEIPTPTLDGLEAIGRAYTDVGLRAVLAPMMADASFYRAIPGLLDALPEPHRSHAESLQTAPHEAHVGACRRLLKNWPHRREQVRPALGPTIPLHCSDAFIRACAILGREFDARIQMHLAESKVQAVSGIKRYGTTLTRHVDALGLLGPNFTGAHSVWLDDEDLKVLRDKGASVAHNPSSNLRLGSGIAPLRRMLDLGIAVGIGTDGSATSDNQNIFAAMRAAAYVSRIVEPDPDRWVGSWEVLRAATIGGAQVLGMDKTIGRVAPGYRADLVFLDMRSVNFVPLNNPAYQIVHCEDSSAVDSVMIGGRMVLDGRRLTTFDFDGLRRKAQSTAERIRQENILKRRQYDAMEKFVSRHCIGLSCEHYHVRRRADAKA